MKNENIINEVDMLIAELQELKAMVDDSRDEKFWIVQFMGLLQMTYYDAADSYDIGKWSQSEGSESFDFVTALKEKVRKK